MPSAKAASRSPSPLARRYQRAASASSARHGVAVAIDFADQRHRRGVFGIVGDALQRLAQRGEEIAALIGAEGEVRRRSGRRSAGRRGGVNGGANVCAAAGTASVRPTASRHRAADFTRSPPRAPPPPCAPRLAAAAIAGSSEGGRPQSVAERDEIGAGRRQRRDVVEPRRVGDARRLEDLRPPGDPLQRFRRAAASIRRGAARRTSRSRRPPRRRSSRRRACARPRRRRCVRDAGSPRRRRAGRRRRSTCAPSAPTRAASRGSPSIRIAAS